MPGTSKAKNPRGIDIEFTEATHAYSSIVDGHHLKYVSGTSFLSRFFPQFDPTGAIAERCAKREGITAEEMRERWAAKGRESTHLGTRLHELCEDVILGNSIRNSPESPSEMKRFTNGKKLAEKLKNTIDILGVEKIVFSHRLPTPIAGTIDLLGRSRKDGSYLILDWKTNKEIERDNKYSKFCLDPIKHIPDTALHHYAL